jgi:dienelactone hydrolase
MSASRVVALGAVAALAAVPVTAQAGPGPSPSVTRTGDGNRVVVPLPRPAQIRDAAPLVLSGNNPLGFGRVSADRRSVVLDTPRAADPAAVRVVWSGGGVPAPRVSTRVVRRPVAPPRAGPAGPQVPVAPAEALPAGLPDPGARGPLATARAAYTLGDTALRVPTGYRTEVTGEVTYPRVLGTRPHPVVVLLHGRHDVCGNARGGTAFDWPCPAGYRRIPSERGYRALADLLASHGLVAVSVAANGINVGDGDAADLGARDRGFLVLHHLDLWRAWSGTNATGPFGARFRGALDFTRVGLMGHSRGGEGVVAALAENRRTGSRYRIRAVVPLAPVDFTRLSVRGTPSLTVVPYCDGDVSDLQGVHFFDDATAGPVDRAPHALLGVFGANHNFFNTVWTPGGWEAGTIDDWYDPTDPFCGQASGRLTPPQQVAAGRAYLAAFLRARLAGQAGYDALFRGATATPPSAAPARTVASWSAPAGRRLLVDDLRSATANALGGATRARGFDAALRCGGDSRYALSCLVPRATGDEPHLSRSYLAPAVPGLRQLHLVWSRPGATWSSALPPAYRNLSGHRQVTVRLARDAWALSDAPPVLALRLRDTTGREWSVRLRGPALTTPVYTGPTGALSGPVPHALVIGAPIPLRAYRGVDLRRIASVTLVALRGSGDMTIGDLSFQR